MGRHNYNGFKVSRLGNELWNKRERLLKGELDSTINNPLPNAQPKQTNTEVKLHVFY